MKTDLFQSCSYCWVSQICWCIECSTLTASSFRILNSSARIPLLPLALFVVMLPKARLTSHSRMTQLFPWYYPIWERQQEKQGEVVLEDFLASWSSEGCASPLSQVHTELQSESLQRNKSLGLWGSGRRWAEPLMEEVPSSSAQDSRWATSGTSGIFCVHKQSVWRTMILCMGEIKW